ncbi:MAG: PrsW family intramembrane metalloprotease, partial [Lachnospiraceae bacterium]|nr:PrsW family intramembrane metalloprotease [Lachnospiraceae bacterium]
MIFLMLIGALVSIVVPNMVYKGILKGVDRTLPNKKYATTFLLSATVYMIPIIIIQLSFDRILHFDSEVVDSIGRCFFISFIRASLLEEGTKFFFVRRVLKKNGALGMKETVLLAGIVGIGFGVLEKTMLGGAAMIANALFPGHMLFQWLMGYYL